MDTKILIKNLKDIFCSSNKLDKKYSEVWLSQVDYGGLYHTNKYYVLNIQAEHKIENCNSEIKKVIQMLTEKAKEELSHIWRVDVYHAEEGNYCQENDLLVFTEAEAC